MSEKRTWYLPVGLYPDEMDDLDRFRDDLLHLGLDSDNNEGMGAIRRILDYFSKPNDAAKELLAALEQLVADWESVSPSDQVPDEINKDSHWDAARAAIAKAKGEAR